jgi:hypothetical protein
VSRDRYFLNDYKIQSVLFVYPLVGFKIFEYLTVVIFNFKLFTCFHENTYCKDWSGSRIMVSVPASLSVIGRLFQCSSSLDAGKIHVNLNVCDGFRYDISGRQAGSCKHFPGQNRCVRVFEEGYWKVFFRIGKGFHKGSKIFLFLFLFDQAS